MSANKELVSKFVTQVWNNKNLDALGDFVAEGYIQHNPNLANGRETLKGFLSGLFQQIPDGTFEIVRMIEENDLIVTHAVFTPAPGAPTMAVVDIYRVENGLLAEHWDVSADIPAETASGNPVV